MRQTFSDLKQSQANLRAKHNRVIIKHDDIPKVFRYYVTIKTTSKKTEIVYCGLIVNDLSEAIEKAKDIRKIVALYENGKEVKIYLDKK